jgi:integrase
MYTGARLSEILKLRWEWVDWQHRLLLLPTSKTGKKSIVLSEPALAILRRVPRVEGNPYVICGEKPRAHLVNLQKTWRRIRKAAGLHDVRIHDLRHSFASFAAAGGASLPMIGALLGHTQSQTTMRYAHLANDPLAEVAEAVGRQIERAANSRTYDGGSGGRGCKIDSPTVDHLPPDRERNRSTVEVGRLTAPIVAVIEGESRSTSGNT